MMSAAFQGRSSSSFLDLSFALCWFIFCCWSSSNCCTAFTTVTSTTTATSRTIAGGGGSSGHTFYNLYRGGSYLFQSSVKQEQEQQQKTTVAVNSVEEATQILTEWDTFYNTLAAAGQQSTTTINGCAAADNGAGVAAAALDAGGDNSDSVTTISSIRLSLPSAVRLLNERAEEERTRDSSNGRCMLGICASNAQQGVATLKSWVTALQLPRGLLHGMDKDGDPIELDGGVYIKYNTGGSLTFADLRKSGVGFEALWRPGDAMLEQYDGKYRGVYFQVELSDGIFRQYLLPLDLFE